jgi:hypothetical protein
LKKATVGAKHLLSTVFRQLKESWGGEDDGLRRQSHISNDKVHGLFVQAFDEAPVSFSKNSSDFGQILLGGRGW